MWTIWKALTNMSMKKTYFSFLSSSQAVIAVCYRGRSLFVTCEMISTIVAKWPLCIVSHPAVSDLSFYSWCSPAKEAHHLFIYCHKLQQIPLQQRFRCISCRKKGIKETSEFNQSPAASGSVTVAVSLLTGVWRPCVQIGSEKKREVQSEVVNFLPVLSGRMFPLPWIPRATCFHYS